MLEKDPWTRFETGKKENSGPVMKQKNPNPLALIPLDAGQGLDWIAGEHESHQGLGFAKEERRGCRVKKKYWGSHRFPKKNKHIAKGLTQMP